MGAATAYFANQRGRDPYLWFAIGLLLGIFGLLLVFILPPAVEETETNQTTKMQSSSPSSVILEVTPEVVVDAPKHDYLIKDWFYFDKAGQQQGPVGFDYLKNLWKEGKINALSFVWSEGMEKWLKIEESPELEQALEDFE